MKKCGSCNKEKSLDEFWKRSDCPKYYRSSCKNCLLEQRHRRYLREEKDSEKYRLLRKKYVEEHKSDFQNRQLKRKYGITLEDKRKMFEEQEEKCFLCEKHFPTEWTKANVDHDHLTNRIRKLLCDGCNQKMVAIDDEDWLQKAISYRAKYRTIQL